MYIQFLYTCMHVCKLMCMCIMHDVCNYLCRYVNMYVLTPIQYQSIESIVNAAVRLIGDIPR